MDKHDSIIETTTKKLIETRIKQQKLKFISQTKVKSWWR